MKVWTDPAGVESCAGGRAVAIGTFDGVHRGHRHLLSALAGNGLEPAVVTFDPHPLSVVRPDVAPLMLSTLDQRLELLAESGVEGALVLPFDPARSRQEARDFVKEVLFDAMQARLMVVGQGFRFGYRASGDVALLRAMAAESDVRVTECELMADASPVSSSRVRALVAAGDVSAAAALLGRPHRVEGAVVHGDARGRELGYPTANLDVPHGSAVPDDGVYAGWLIMDPYSDSRTRYPAAISVGTNPTFHGTSRRVEAFAIDRTGLDLYDRPAAIDFVERLRGQVAFSGIEPLMVQMAADVDACRKILGG